MILKELVKDKGENTLSLSRTIALATFIVLSVGFCLACYKKPVADTFWTYPLGVMIVFVPQLVVRFITKLESVIKAWKGNSTE